MLAWTLGLFLGWLPVGVQAAEPLGYEVDAVLDPDRTHVEIETRIRVQLAAEESELRLWLMADRWAVSPPLDERSARWIYPGEVSLGGLTDLEVFLDEAPMSFQVEALASGREAGGSDLIVPLEAGEAREVVLRIHVRLEVPDRFGRMGRARGELALLSPWYPLLVGTDSEGRQGWAYEVPHRVRVACEGGQVVLSGGGSSARGDVTSPAELAALAPYVSLFAATQIHEAHQDAGGVEVRVLGGAAEHRPPPPDAAGFDGVDDAAAIDRVALIREVVLEALGTARWLGLPIPSEVVLVSVRSRVELAGRAPGVVVISDRLFQIFPLDVVREFHRTALRRAVLGVLAEAASASVELPSDRGWAADLRGVVLLELDEVRRSAVARRPEDLLSLFAFHPAVDSLLYAPQITFEQVYFGSVDETDPFRDDPFRARAVVSGGRRLLQCARDALGDEQGARLIAMLAHARRSARSALRQVGAEDAVDAWLAYASLALNYRLGAVSSEPVPEGGYRHRIEVLRDGDERDEQVDVEVEDVSGHRALGHWDGRGPRGVVELETPSLLASATIDPEHRLPQSAAVADGHPRADDATSQPFRPPILNAFALSLLLSEANVTGLVEFAIRQRYDLEHTVSIRLSRTVARTGGRLRYVQGLGPKVHTNRRLGAVGGGLGVSYIEPGYGGSALGGWALELDLSGGIDSRSYIYDPRSGYSLAALVTLTGTLREDGSLNLGARGAFRGGYLAPVGLLNVFAFVVGGGFTVGPALNADLQSLGGANGLRGFANDELLGTGALYGVMEHRITAISDMAINLMHLVWVREMQLAWWLGVGGIFETTDGRAAVFALEAGGGVRFHYEYGAIQPGVLSLDVGVPISRFWDNLANSRPPIGFYVAFDQYY